MSIVVGTGFGWSAPSTQTIPLLGIWNPSTGAWDGITPGAANTVLAMNGTGNGYSFVNPATIAPVSNFITAATGTLVSGEVNIITFATTCTVTIPATVPDGALIDINGGAGNFIVTPSAGQTITWAGSTGVTGPTGVLTALAPNMDITLVCTVANTAFQVRSVSNGSASLVT